MKPAAPVTKIFMNPLLPRPRRILYPARGRRSRQRTRGFSHRGHSTAANATTVFDRLRKTALRGDRPMASRASMSPDTMTVDTANLYREEVYSDLRAASVRVLSPVKADGSADP